MQELTFICRASQGEPNHLQSVDLTRCCPTASLSCGTSEVTTSHGFNEQSYFLDRGSVLATRQRPHLRHCWRPRLRCPCGITLESGCESPWTPAWLGHISHCWNGFVERSRVQRCVSRPIAWRVRSDLHTLVHGPVLGRARTRVTYSNCVPKLCSATRSCAGSPAKTASMCSWWPRESSRAEGM